MKKIIKISSFLVALSFLHVSLLVAAPSDEERDSAISDHLSKATVIRYRSLSTTYSDKDQKMKCYDDCEEAFKFLSATVAGASGLISLITAGESESTSHYVAGGVALVSTLLSLLTLQFGKKYTYYQGDDTRTPLDVLIDDEYKVLKDVAKLRDESELLLKRRIELVLERCEI